MLYLFGILTFLVHLGSCGFAFLGDILQVCPTFYLPDTIHMSSDDSSSKPPGDSSSKPPGDPSSKPPGDPSSKPSGDPSSKSPGDPSLKDSEIAKNRPIVKTKKESTTNRYVQLIKSLSKYHKNKAGTKEASPITESFEVKQKVEVVKPEQQELKKKLNELSLKIEKLKSDTKSVISETSSKLTELEASVKSNVKDMDKDLSGKKVISKLSTKVQNFSKGTSKLKDKTDLKKETSKQATNVMSSFQDFVKKLQSFGERLVSQASSKMSSSSAPGRPMKYPYTYSAKIAQFPFKFYIKNNWMWRYYFIALGVSFPIFYKLGRMSNSPENVRKWAEIRERDFTPGGHH